MGEIVDADKTGEVVEPGNEKPLAMAINKVIKNPDNYHTRFNPELENKYNWEHIGKLTLQCYEKAISQKQI